MKKIVLFDGDCLFCNGSVQFIMKRDPKAHFQFASLQSEPGERLLRQLNIPSTMDSLVLIEGNQYYTKSTAALKICLGLKGLWKVFFVFIVVPSCMRDRVYDYIARNRYKWFGASNECKLPSADERERFL